MVLFKSGDVKGDVDEQLEALHLEPKYALAHSEIAWIYATEGEVRNPVEALKHAQIAVELNQWKSPGIIETLAESQFLNGMYKEAVETERKALQLDPDSKDFKKNLKRYQDALKKNRKS